MQHIRAIIVDDDEFIRETLKDALSDWSDWITVSGTFDNPVEALSFLTQYKTDLIFLDIQMPVLSGFELLDKLGDNPPRVIFITSFSEYAIKAIRYSALDYLLKPIKNEELKAALDRFSQQVTGLGQREQFASLTHNLKNRETANQVIAVPFSNGIKSVPIQNIIMFEAHSNYTWIIMNGNQKILSSKTLKEYEDLFTDYAFVRPNRSQLINRTLIEGWYVKDSVQLLLKDQSSIAVSRRRVSEIKGMVMEVTV